MKESGVVHVRARRNDAGWVSTDPTQVEDGDVAPALARRRMELVIGAVFVAAGVFGSLWLQRTGAESVMVLGASRALDTTRSLDVGDFVAVAVPRSIADAFVPRDAAQEFVGGSVRASIRPGEPIPRALVSAQPVLGSEDVLVPALIDAGSYPPDLAPGDRVMVAVSPDPGMVDARPPVLVDEPVAVWSVHRRDDGSDAAIVTLVATSRVALQVAGAGSVRIAIVGTP